METVYTIGHSTRTITEFIELLKLHAITQLIDIRTIPKSRHNPQFGQEKLKGSLKQSGIEYRYLKELGGLRPAQTISLNSAWRNQSFKNYADYMQTQEFDQAIDTLLELGDKKVTAIMCAEAVPWRCHRSLVGDALVVRGLEVLDIIDKTNIKKHVLTSFAKVEGISVTYPGE